MRTIRDHRDASVPFELLFQYRVAVNVFQLCRCRTWVGGQIFAVSLHRFNPELSFGAGNEPVCTRERVLSLALSIG